MDERNTVPAPFDPSDAYRAAAARNAIPRNPAPMFRGCDRPTMPCPAVAK